MQSVDISCLNSKLSANYDTSTGHVRNAFVPFALLFKLQQDTSTDYVYKEICKVKMTLNN